MHRRMLVNVVESEESRIAILSFNSDPFPSEEDSKNNKKKKRKGKKKVKAKKEESEGKNHKSVLEELYIEQTSRSQIVGNIYKAKVINVEPSMQAAFVDFGWERNGFIHISDIIPKYWIDKEAYSRFRKRSEGDSSNVSIKSALQPGQEIIIQVVKEGLGKKGPAVTTYLSLPGRYLVLMPDVMRYGVSRKIANEEKRRELKILLHELDLPADMGVIVRTAGSGRTKTDLSRDLNYLTKLWKAILKRSENSAAPCPVYRESDLVIRTIRDIFTTDIKEIIIDSPEEYQRVKEFLKLIMPRHNVRVRLYSENEPLFHKYDIEDEIEKIYQRKVPLGRGGSIVIDQTEALVSIDVNSGKFKEEDNAEETAFHTNMEAAPEIARQLRLRDLGGVIVCDFIDMVDVNHRRAIEKLFWEELKKDRARTKMLRMSNFGIIEVTRQRVRPSPMLSQREQCPYCKGTGSIKTVESVSLSIMRRIKSRLQENIREAEILVNPEVAAYIQNEKRREIVTLEDAYDINIKVKGMSEFNVDDSEIKFIREDGRKIIL